MDELERLDLLFRMGDLFIPESVAYEAEKHCVGITGKIQRYIVEEVSTLSRNLAELIRESGLGAGETAALAWVEKLGADLFISDDQAARDAADDLGYQSTGTLGVICDAADSGLITTEEAVALVQSVPLRTTLFTTPSLLQKVLASLR
ncbi:MAG: hypothetical protein ABI318_05235 [Chthoniobacteraceae bacterium]